MNRLGFVAALLFAMPLSAGELTLNGEGKVSSKPDVGYVHLGVVTEAATASEAVAQNSAAMTKLFATLEAKKVARSDIQTSDFSVQPRYSYPQNGQGEPKFLGYAASNQVMVTVCELPNMGAVLDAVVVDGANRVGGVSFDVKDKKPLLDAARVAAAKDAQDKAALHANAFGVKLKEIKSIHESGGGSRPPMYGMKLAMSADRADVPVSGGSLSFQINVQVVWVTE